MAEQPGGASGLRGFAGLFVEAAGRLRESGALRRSLTFWLVLGAALTEAFTVIVAAAHGVSSIPVLAAGAVAWWAIVALILVGGTSMLVTPDHRRLDHYGLPNGLTALRAWASYPLILCAVLSLPDDLGLTLWCTVGWVSGMLDYVDGVIARRVGPITQLGKALDPASDSLFFMMAAVGNVPLGIVPPWLAVVILVRFAGPLAATPLVFLTRRRPEITHTRWGRWNTGATGVVFFILMWVRIFHGPVGAVALVVGLPTLVPSALLHFRSLWLRARAAPVLPARRA